MGTRQDTVVIRPAEQLSAVAKLTIWLLLIAVAGLAIYAITPPAPLGETAPPDQFSAARAKAHLVQIAREPHPIGTAANQRVRDYLVQQLSELGAEVRVERSVGLHNSGRQIYAATVENIVATIKGSGASDRAVMLASHYDSVPQGPGAADAGAGVVAILEVLRALKAGAALRNDLLILFTDGEEEGLVGASAFVRDHPDIAQRVGVVLNLEARGSSGTVLMFETSSGNGWITREFARAAPYPFASSLAYAVYERMPNDTDLTVFKRAGLQGLNFAFSGTLENYHTARDTPENLDPRSLQQMGANTLALARHFGGLELPQAREQDRIYFNSLGSWIVDYRAWFVWVMLAVIVVLLAAALVVGRRRGTITSRRTLVAAIASTFIIAAPVAAAHLVAWAVHETSEKRLLVGDTWSNLLIALGCVAAALAFGLPVQARLTSMLREQNAAAGQLVLLAICTTAISYLLPAASYVLQWPLVFSLAAFLVVVRSRSSALAGLLGIIPALLIFAPLTYLLFVVLGMNSTALAVIGAVIGVLLMCGAMLMPRISHPLRRLVSILLLVSVALVGVGLWMSRFSAEHPQRNSVLYSLDADESKAAWVSYDDAADAWTAQFLTGSASRGSIPGLLAGNSREVLHGPAELLPLTPPTAAVVDDRRDGDRRVVKLHLSSPRDADALLMRLPAELKISSIVVNGRSHDIDASGESRAAWLLRYNAPPPEGVEIELHMETPRPFTLWLADRAYGLPEMPGKTYRPRPAEMISSYGSDVTLVTRQYRF